MIDTNNLTEEQIQSIQDTMAVFLPEEAHRQLISKLSKTDITIIQEVIVTIFYVSKEELNQVKNDKDYLQMLSLLELSKNTNTIKQELIDIYNNNKKQALRNLQIKRGRIVRSILGSKLKEYQNLKRRQEYDKCKLILERKINSSSEKIKEKLDLLNADIDKIKSDHYFLTLKLSATMLRANVSNTNILEYYAYIINNPKCQLTSLIYTDESWDSFPLKWMHDILYVSDLRRLFREYKNGDDISYFLTDKYNNDDFSDIQKVLKSPFINGLFSRTIGERVNIINEVIGLYKNKNYIAVIYTSLPQIEGIIWSFSKFVNIRTGEIYTDDTHKIIISDSGEIKNPTIGDLLKKTKIRDYLQSEFIEYFCDELYDERNDLLHGEALNRLTHDNAAKKLATIEFLLSQINKYVKDEFTAHIKDSFSSEYINELIDKYLVHK